MFDISEDQYHYMQHMQHLVTIAEALPLIPTHSAQREYISYEYTLFVYTASAQALPTSLTALIDTEYYEIAKTLKLPIIIP